MYMHLCSRALPNQSGRVSGLSHLKRNSQAQDHSKHLKRNSQAQHHSNCNRNSTQQYSWVNSNTHGLVLQALLCSAAHFDSKCDAGYKVEHTVTAHSGGLQTLDARGNFLATCGYSMRLGQVALDNTVKVPVSLHLYQHLSVCTPAVVVHAKLAFTKSGMSRCMWHLTARVSLLPATPTYSQHHYVCESSVRVS